MDKDQAKAAAVIYAQHHKRDSGSMAVRDFGEGWVVVDPEQDRIVPESEIDEITGEPTGGLRDITCLFADQKWPSNITVHLELEDTDSEIVEIREGNRRIGVAIGTQRDDVTVWYLFPQGGSAGIELWDFPHSVTVLLNMRSGETV